MPRGDREGPRRAAAGARPSRSAWRRDARAVHGSVSVRSRRTTIHGRGARSRRRRRSAQAVVVVPTAASTIQRDASKAALTARSGNRAPKVRSTVANRAPGPRCRAYGGCRRPAPRWRTCRSLLPRRGGLLRRARDELTVTARESGEEQTSPALLATASHLKDKSVTVISVTLRKRAGARIISVDHAAFRGRRRTTADPHDVRRRPRARPRPPRRGRPTADVRALRTWLKSDASVDVRRLLHLAHPGRRRAYAPGPSAHPLPRR